MMGLDMEFVFDKSSSELDQSPNTVLPPLRSGTEKKHTRGKTTRRDDILKVKDGFTEISFRRYRSSSCKNTSSRPSGSEKFIEQKRGSIYQSSKEVSKMKRNSNVEGRNKHESVYTSCDSSSSSSFRIVDSLCSLDEETKWKRPTGLDPPCSSGGFLAHADMVGKDRVTVFHRSHSAKVESPVPYSLSLSGNDLRCKESSRNRLSKPIKKMFDPFTKSKSLRSPLGYYDESKTTGKDHAMDKTFRKSLLRDFSNTTTHSDAIDSRFPKKDHGGSALAQSPVHLHGLLKFENNNGMPIFELSLDFPGDVYVAKTWKDNDGVCNWVYTFHSIGNRKKSNAGAWGTNESGKQSPSSSLIGQMQVACYECSDLNENGGFNNSIVKEFVLYDIAHARQSVSVVSAVSDPEPCESGSVVGGCELDGVKGQHRARQSGNDGFNTSESSYPWSTEDLRPDLEIAAIVIRDPFEKRERLKYKRGDNVSRMKSLLNLPIVEHGNKTDVRDRRRSPEKMKVAISTGKHGLPSGETIGPSSLFERWKLGGGCDCGGWDMACPLIVFGNPDIQCLEDQQLVENGQPLELFIQGSKEGPPALTMTYLEEGQYAVDFHAQLSALQAFSICVAIVHATLTSTSRHDQITAPSLQCSSLKLLIDEEVRFLIEADMKKPKMPTTTKTMKRVPPSYMPNPPFSPIARV